MDSGLLIALLDSWIIHLRAEHKSPNTCDAYARGIRQFLAWAERTGVEPALDRRTVSAFTADVLGGGAEPTTARNRQLALRRFSAWLADEDEIARDELIGLKAPKVDVKITESLTDRQLGELIKACGGKELRDRRDEAIVRLMAESGVRCDEVISMTVADVKLADGLANVRRGKGGKGRVVPFGPSTGRAVDRYLRLRRAHRLADTQTLWLGERGQGFAYGGLWMALGRRARIAGIDGFHPHLLRHTAAARWLDAGGSEGGLMAVAGWSQRSMIDRYVRATSQRRAAEEARRLNLGEI